MSLRKLILGAAAGALMSSPSWAAPLNSSMLQPINKAWDLDYGLTQCIALRQYGDAAKPVNFAIVPAPNGETYELLIARKRGGPAAPQEFQGSVDFGSGPINAWLLEYPTKDGKLMVDQFRIGAAQMAQARSANRVTVHTQGEPDVSFELDHIPALLDGLQTCTSDLQDFWNMGGEKNGRIATVSRGDVRTVFSANDYPSQALSYRQQGDSQFLLLIDEKGKVAGCHVLLASGVPLLDAMGCAVIQERARFDPALDSTGKAVRSTFVTPKVRWKLR